MPVPDSVAQEFGPIQPLHVIQYWHADQPPEPIVELRATFRRHNPGLQQTLFNESSAHHFIAERFSPREAAAFRACASPTSQADYLRYCAGYALGGLCIDADVRCDGNLSGPLGSRRRGVVFGQTQPLADWIERIFAWPHGVGPYRTLVNGAFAFVQPGAPLLGLAVEVATANIENRVADGPNGVWVTTGPGVFTSLYLLNCLGSIDAFMRYVDGTVLEPSASLFCEVVENPVRIDQALAGVDIAPVEMVGHWSLEHIGVPRSAEGVSHWSNPGVSIFR